MGMTIEELVETAQKYNCMIVTKDMWNTALGSAHKLQKIEEIVNHYKNNVRDKVTNENMEKILEVVDNGNDSERF